MSPDLKITDEGIACVRSSITEAYRAIDLPSSSHWSNISAHSFRLRRARENAETYAAGALALSAFNLMQISNQLIEIDARFCEVDQQCSLSDDPA